MATFDKSKGQIIDEELIRTSIIEDRLSLVDSTTNYEEEDNKINYDVLTILILSFKNIIKIGNLHGFENLWKLQLDNNYIDKIENLDHLVNLKWLDLSFNKINKIENLDKLIYLTDLSLYHNQIGKIENLEKLTNLQILSLGHNFIISLEDMHYLRQFKKLKCVTMQNNPVCKDENYNSTIIAYLKNMSYLDYELITPQQVKAAREDRHEEMHELEEKEKLIEIEEAKESALRQKALAAEEANLVGIEYLFADMMREDPELAKLKLLPGYSEILENYKEQFEEITVEFMHFIFSKYHSKKREQQMCAQALAQIKSDSESASKIAVDKYTHLKKLAFIKFEQEKINGSRSKHSNPKDHLDSLQGPLQDLSDSLMELELQQSDSTSRIFDDLYEALKSLQTDCLLSINNYTQRIFELEKVYYESTLKSSQFLQEKHAAGQLMPTLDDSVHAAELKVLIEDKDLVSQCIQASHEKHEEMINAVEGAIGERERLFTEKYVQSVRDIDYLRNRQRISEIFNLIERNKSDNLEKAGASTSVKVVHSSHNSGLPAPTTHMHQTGMMSPISP